MGSYVDFQLFRFSGFPSPHPTPSGLPAVYQPKRRIRSRWLSTSRRISTQPCQQAGLFLCGPKGSEMEENEVKKIKQLFRKGVALALAAITTLSVLPAATVSAASQRATITFAYCYDGNGNKMCIRDSSSLGRASSPFGRMRVHAMDSRKHLKPISAKRAMSSDVYKRQVLIK